MRTSVDTLSNRAFSLARQLAFLVSLSLANLSWALPTLQLDIVGGVYDPVTQTTVASGPIFTLRALLNDTLNTSLNYYVSAAVEPMLSQYPVPDFGSFVIDGTTYNSGSNTQWGTPPVDVVDDGSGNLAPHDMFPTYYGEVLFHFDASHTVAAYNTQDGSSAPGLLYYHDFSVDVTGLDIPDIVHFDLYDEKVKKGDWTIDDFAPFSHDAESGHNVPDGGSTVLLLGLAISGLALAGRCRHRKAA